MVIYENMRYRGYIGLGEPTFKLAARRRLGLEDGRPLERTVNNFIFRLEQPGQVDASEILRQWEEQAHRDWRNRYGWHPVHWESMVLPSAGEEVPGYCYRRAGWRSLGLTTGRSARRPAGATHGPRIWTDAEPKLVLYKGPLARLPKGTVPFAPTRRVG